MEGCPCLRRFIHLLRAFDGSQLPYYKQRLFKRIFIGTCQFQQNANLYYSKEIEDVTTIQLTNAHLVFVCDRGIEVTGY